MEIIIGIKVSYLVGPWFVTNLSNNLILGTIVGSSAGKYWKTEFDDANDQKRVKESLSHLLLTSSRQGYSRSRNGMQQVNI